MGRCGQAESSPSACRRSNILHVVLVIQLHNRAEPILVQDALDIAPLLAEALGSSGAVRPSLHAANSAV
jgi:hypothetical protein